MGIEKRIKNLPKSKVRANQLRSFGAYGIAILLIAVALIGLRGYVDKYKQEVQVLSVKYSLPGKVILSTENIAPMTLSKNDFKEGMIPYEEHTKYLGKFVTSFVHKDTAIFKDIIADKVTKKYEYLYTLKADEELVTFPYNYQTSGGRLVKPGDRLRVRGSYPIIDPVTGEATGVVRSDIVFDSVVVTDMLNAVGDSVFEIIKYAEELPPAEKDTYIKSEAYKTAVTPTSILFVATIQQANKYADFVANNEVQFFITVLSRDERIQDLEFKVPALIDILQPNSENSSQNPSGLAPNAPESSTPTN